MIKLNSETSTNLGTATRNLTSTMTELISTKSDVADLTIKLNGKINKKFVLIREV
jgi:hypothetical protein